MRKATETSLACEVKSASLDAATGNVIYDDATDT